MWVFSGDYWQLQHSYLHGTRGTAARRGTRFQRRPTHVHGHGMRYSTRSKCLSDDCDFEHRNRRSSGALAGDTRAKSPTGNRRIETGSRSPTARTGVDAPMSHAREPTNGQGQTNERVGPPAQARPAAGTCWEPKGLGVARLLALQRLAGNRAATVVARSARAPAPVVQRDRANHQPLAKVQGLPMFALLPTLEGFPVGVRTDEAAARVVGGPRLVTALRVVAARKSPWKQFRAVHAAELNGLPADQVENISAYLKARDIGKLRSTIQAIPASQIRSKWAARKQDFIAAASDPSNSLGAGQMYQIWLRYWVDEQAEARRKYQVQLDAVRSAGLQAYLEKRKKFDAGVRGLYPAEFEAAADRLAAADFYSSYLVGVHDWLETYVGGRQRHVTLEQVNLKTVELIKGRDLRTAILSVVIAIAAVPAPRRVTPKGEGPLGATPPEGPAGGGQKVWGGGGPEADVIPLYRYCKTPGDVLPNGWWTTRPAANRAEAARITGVPENEMLYQQKVLINSSAAKHGKYFKQGQTRSVGDSLVEEFRNVTTIPGKNIEVTPVKKR